MGKSWEMFHSIKIHVSAFITQRNLLVPGNFPYELAKTRMDGIKEKRKDLGALDVPKSHRGNQQQKLDVLLQSPADVGRSYKKNASSIKNQYQKKTETYP